MYWCFGEQSLFFFSSEFKKCAVFTYFFYRIESGYFETGPTTGFRKFFLFLHGMWMYACPFFVENIIYRQGQEKIIIFPWRSPLATYDPLNEGKYRKYSLFWKMGGFSGKGRTPGERWPKFLEWTHWCSSKPLGSQHGLLRRNSFFKTQYFQN